MGTRRVGDLASKWMRTNRRWRLAISSPLLLRPFRRLILSNKCNQCQSKTMYARRSNAKKLNVQMTAAILLCVKAWKGCHFKSQSQSLAMLRWKSTAHSNINNNAEQKLLNLVRNGPTEELMSILDG